MNLDNLWARARSQDPILNEEEVKDLLEKHDKGWKMPVSKSATGINIQALLVFSFTGIIATILYFSLSSKKSPVRDYVTFNLPFSNENSKKNNQSDNEEGVIAFHRNKKPQHLIHRNTASITEVSENKLTEQLNETPKITKTETETVSTGAQDDAYANNKPEINEPTRNSILGWHLAGENSYKYSYGIDNVTSNSGNGSGYINSREATAANAWLSQTISAEYFAGRRIMLSGYVRCENTGKKAWAGMFMGVSGYDFKYSSYDNMSNRRIRENGVWKKCQIVLDVPTNARCINFGLYKVSTGKAWIDDIDIHVVDKDIATTNPIKTLASDTAATKMERQLTRRNGYIPNPDIMNPGLEKLNSNSKMPGGWLLGSEDRIYRIGTDSLNKIEGNNSAYLAASKTKTANWNTLFQIANAEKYRGKKIRISAYLRTDYLQDYASFWARVDKSNVWHNLDNMPHYTIYANSEWRKYNLVVDVPTNATTIAFGLILKAGGKVWIDDVTIENVGKANSATAYLDEEPPFPSNLDFEN